MTPAGGEYEQIIISEICQQFSWTIQQFDSQPSWFLDLIVMKMKHTHDELSKAERKAKLKYGGS